MDFNLTSQQRQIRALAREVIAPQAARYDQEACFPHPLVAEARKLGFTHLLIPEEYARLVEAILAKERRGDPAGWGAAHGTALDQ